MRFQSSKFPYENGENRYKSNLLLKSFLIVEANELKFGTQVCAIFQLASSSPLAAEKFQNDQNLLRAYRVLKKILFFPIILFYF